MLESEKEQGYYWAFDTKELTRGNIKERYDAYEVAVRNNILQIDNELFVKAQDGMIIAGLSRDDVKTSLKALEDEASRLFSKKTRRFAPKDFAWIHADPKVLGSLDDGDELDLDEVKKMLDDIVMKEEVDG
mgnify:CR=1 FL=1